MAIHYPGADVRQLPGKSRTLLRPDRINVHTMVGTLAGTQSWFTPSGRPYSHFGVGGAGAVRQWQDLLYRAASDLYGNPFCISIETEDMGLHFPSWGGTDVPPWTEKQIDALVKLIDWLCAKFRIPPVLLTDSCGGRGISYHRLGIDPYRRADCTRFSNARGKICPSDPRIEQLQDIVLPRVRGEEDEDEMTPEQAEATFIKCITQGGHPFRSELAKIIDSRIDIKDVANNGELAKRRVKPLIVAADRDSTWYKTDGMRTVPVRGRAHVAFLVKSNLALTPDNAVNPYLISQADLDELLAQSV